MNIDKYQLEGWVDESNFVLNEIESKSSKIHFANGQGQNLAISIKDENLRAEILKSKISELPEGIDVIEVSKHGLHELNFRHFWSFQRLNDKNLLKVSFKSSYDDWGKEKTARRVWESIMLRLQVKNDEFPSMGCELKTKECLVYVEESVLDESITFNYAVERLESTLIRFLEQHALFLKLESDNIDLEENFLIFKNRFPDKYRVAFEQYLIYFSQFLTDLGLDANVELRQTDGKSILEITPSSKELIFPQFCRHLACL